MRRSTLLVLLLLLFAVSSSAAITGTVVDAGGAPLAGARVRAFVREPLSAIAARLLSKTPDAAPLATAETAANGSFSIDAKGNATVDVVVDAAAHDPAAVTAADGEDAGAIPLHAAGTHPGRVSAGGQPVPNALVYVGRSLLVRSDASGGFPLAGTGEPLFIVHPDYAVAAGMPRDGAIALEKGKTVSGRVVGRDGAAAVAGAVVSVGGWPLGRSDENGAFTIGHVPPRAKTIVAVSPDAAGAAPLDPSKPVTIRLGTASSLGGSVTSSKGGAPVAGATVTIDDEHLSAITDARGHYSFAALLPATYSAAVSHPSYTLARVPGIRVTPQATARSFALLPRPRVRGTVIGEDRKPVPNALVSVGSAQAATGLSSAAATGANGEFTLRLPLTGIPITLLAAKGGYVPAIFGPVTLDAGETKSGVTISLVRGFPLQVKVLDGEKRPVARARVELVAAGADVSRSRTPVPCSIVDPERCRLTAADGSVELRIAEGKYDVNVTGEFVPVALLGQALTARSSPLTVAVEGGVEVSGIVTLGDGTPVAGAHVAPQASNARATVTNADGTFRLQHVGRTPLTLVATSGGDQPLQSAPVDVRPPARDVKLTIPTPATIEGRVTDRTTLQPVTSFTVTPVRKSSVMPLRGATFENADGSFTLTNVPAGALELRVNAAGYVPGNVTDLTVDEGKTLGGVEVKLDRGARLTGHVTSAGKSIGGVAVRSASRLNRASAQAVTDEDGTYALDGVPAGEQTFEFIRQGFVPKRKSADVAAGKETRLDVELDRGSEVGGRVTERNGQPVAGARINMSAAGSQYPASGTSDAEGQFTLSGLDDGRYKATVFKNGFVTATLDDVRVPLAQPLAIALDRGGTISGRVTGIPEAELPQVHVTATGQGSNATQGVDEAGNFTLNGIPDGRVTIMAYRYGARLRQSPAKVIDVVNGSAPPVTIDFASGISVRGRVTRNGAPLGGGNISFVPRGPSTQPSASAMIAGDGTYEVNGLEPGDHDVHVNTGGANDAVRYTVTGNATFDVDLHGGAVRGVVVDGATGAPLADARVYTVPGRDSRTYRTTTSDSNGRFLLDLIPDGTIEVRAARDPYAPAAQSVTVSSGTAPPVELRLTRGAEAVVRIVDGETGASLAGTIVLTEAQKKAVANGSLQGDDGAIHLWVEPGQYTAAVHVPGYMAQSVDVTVPGPEVRAVVRRGAKLVLTSRGGGRFRITPPRVAGAGGIVTTTINIPIGERVPIDGLAPGLYQVDKIGADMKSVLRSYSVALTAGQTATLDAD